MRIARLQLILFTLLATFTLSAQTFEQLTYQRLNEAPMNVRSAGMGAVAEDDMSANPASIASLKKMQFSAGGARTSYMVHEFILLDPVIAFSQFVDLDSQRLSHASVTVPIGGFVAGAYYRAEPELRTRYPLAEAGAAPYVAHACPVGSCGVFFGASSSAFRRDEKRYGLTAAWERGNLSVGVGAELQELDERADILRLRFDHTLPRSTFDRLMRSTSDRDVVPNAGIRWRVTPKVALAAAYNGGATFTRTTDICEENSQLGCASEIVRLAESKHRTADAIRASVSVQPAERFFLVAEAVRRNYGKLADEEYSVAGTAVRLPYQDVTELHAGAEYRFEHIAIRLGWWRDPARHGVQLFYPGFQFDQEVEHLTYGAGINIGPARVDLAWDESDIPAMSRASVGVTFGVPSL